MREVAAASGSKQGYDRRYRYLSEEEIKQREDRGESFVIRMKTPLTGECVFEDAIKGKIVVPWADVDDQVLLKSDNFPTYHLANVVDDHLMGITHVIRGDEWITSTPKHVFLYESFGWKAPQFMHMPLLLGKDGKKLSKRKNPTSIFYYRDTGYLPEAFVNFLTLMGYSMQDGREVYPLADIIKDFDEKRFGVSGAIFDLQKLDWMNQQYLISNIPQDTLWDRLKGWNFNDNFMNRLMPLCHTRMKTFTDFMELSSFLFVNNLPLTEELFHIDGFSKEASAFLFQTMIWQMDAQENWASSGAHEASKACSELFKVNHKKVTIPLLFVAIQGKRHGLPLFDSIELLGKDRTRVRFLNAIEFLGGISNKKLDSLKKAYDAKDISRVIQEVK